MPYIPQEDRDELDPHIESLTVAIRATVGAAAKTDGVMAYVTTRLFNRIYAKDSYAQYAMLVGVLMTVLLESYRRRVAPYEDDKLGMNGDVFL